MTTTKKFHSTSNKAIDNNHYHITQRVRALLDEMGLNTVKLRDSRYDAVLHLVTAANGAEQFYTTANNKARSEGIEQACALDKKIIKAWTDKRMSKDFWK